MGRNPATGEAIKQESRFPSIQRIERSNLILASETRSRIALTELGEPISASRPLVSGIRRDCTCRVFTPKLRVVVHNLLHHCSITCWRITPSLAGAGSSAQRSSSRSHQ
jgi:hypothetical protein